MIAPLLDGLGGWIQALLESSLTATDKVVMMSLIYHCNWETGANCWPSVKLVAWEATLSDRAVHGSLNRLHECGVVEYVRQSRGGTRCTHRLRLRLDRLRAIARSDAATPEAASGSTAEDPQHRGAEPRTSFAPTPKAAHANPERPSGEHSIHNKPLEQTIPNHPENRKKNCPVPNGMDGPSADREMLFEFLSSVGVAGDNLYRFLDCKDLTFPKAQAEWQQVQREVAAGACIRNPVKLLVHRLGKRFGVNVRSKRANLAPDVCRFMQVVHQKRQHPNPRDRLLPPKAGNAMNPQGA